MPRRSRQGSALTTFSELGVDPDIADALSAVGITSAFPIQALTLPLALSGNDLIGQAKTGTGKTLGFGIPILQRIPSASPATPGKPRALIVVPTRELCVQVAEDLAVAGARRGIKVLAVYGGRAIEPQIAALKEGVHVVVGTPGRLLDLSGQRVLNLGEVQNLVLDEADQMLDMGFLPDVEKLLALTPIERQTMLFSATLPGPIVTMGRRHLRKPTQIRATDPDNDNATVEGVEQHVLRVHNLDKDEVLARILQSEGRGLSIVFVSTKRSAARVTEELQARGFSVGAVHGDLDQGARERALRAFRGGKVDVLIATDVAARGLDVDNVTHVINYACPKDPQTYLHRIGRTARAGAKGVAITFVDWDALHLWTGINREHLLGFEEPIETYSTSPHLFENLKIPEGTTGRLPKASRTREGLEAEELEDIGGPGRKPERESRSGRDSGREGSRDGGRERSGRGGRERGGESRGSKRGEANGAASGAGPAASDDGEPRRTRRRGSRGGSGATDNTGAESGTPSTTGESGEPRRRRRTRGGASSGGESATADASSSTSGDQPAGSGDGSGDGTRRRRRSRGGKAVAGDAPASTDG